MNNKKRIEILERFKEHNPNPSTELKWNSTYELLVAVMLSAQATDKSVNKATEILFAKANTPEKIVQLGKTKVKEYIKTIGLYNNKAANLLNLSKILIDKFSGQVPENREALESLPGVGRKTANVVLNTAFKWPTIAVDTHIFRVCNRTKFATGKNVTLVEKKLLKVVPAKYKLNVHHWIILHGRYTCTARKPACKTCLIYDLCEFKDKVNL